MDLDAEVGGAPVQRAQHVAQRRRLQAGDDGQAARVGRQRAFAFGGEEAFIFKLCLEPQEAFVEIALAGATQRFDSELELAARLVEGDQRAGLHLLPVLRAPAQELRPVAPDHATHLGIAVLEREIDVAGGGAGQVGNFAAHPEQRKGGLQTIAH
ncbi:hypothetical protein SDC9_207230 [bioreactor metagenome]|uniref:Uncharacterized protein n=1 Tax=bioreactor metagenome TaxID=1076179 RepID=A0A645J9V3_9ZZZZ